MSNSACGKLATSARAGFSSVFSAPVNRIGSGTEPKRVIACKRSVIQTFVISLQVSLHFVARATKRVCVQRMQRNRDEPRVSMPDATGLSNQNERQNDLLGLRKCLKTQRERVWKKFHTRSCSPQNGGVPFERVGDKLFVA